MASYTYTAGQPTPTLQQRMYYFIPHEVRRSDQVDGTALLERFLDGHQSVWETTTSKALSVPNLWDVSLCPDKFLIYLKAIVGWTAKWDSITSGLSNDLLRRLISVSAQLWSKRGSEEALLDVVRLLFKVRCTYTNWFGYRWVLDETELGSDLAGTDPWIVGEPWGSDRAESWSTLRVMDGGSLDRTLLRNVVRLMRAGGERWEIVYLSLVDTFLAARDNTQWGSGPTVSGGKVQLSDDSIQEAAECIVSGATSWAQYMVTARLAGTSAASGGEFGLMFHWQDASNHYAFVIDTVAQTFAIKKVVGGTPATLASVAVSATALGAVYDGVYNVFRVVTITEGANIRIKVILDGLVVLEYLDSSAPFAQGSVGFYHAVNATIECSYIEVMPLPGDSETVELQT